MSIEYIITFALISAVGIILASILNIASFTRAQTHVEKEHSTNLASSLATMTASLDHIEANIGGVRHDVSDIKHDIKDQRDRLVRVEEAAKAAHNRLDELRRYGGNGE